MSARDTAKDGNAHGEDGEDVRLERRVNAGPDYGHRYRCPVCGDLSSVSWRCLECGALIESKNASVGQHEWAGDEVGQ